MKKNLFISIVAILIGGFFALSVVADDKHDHNTLVKFKGGIGVHPNLERDPGRATGAVIVNRNIVRGVNPAGQIWTIKDLEAKIKTNGDIKIRGRGSVAGWRQQYRKSERWTECRCPALFVAAFTEHSTILPGVALEVNGDFKIERRAHADCPPG